MARRLHFLLYKHIILTSNYLINDSSSYELLVVELDSIKPPAVRYYTLTYYVHVLMIIGSDNTAFGLGCTAYLCNGYFEIRTRKVLPGR